MLAGAVIIVRKPDNGLDFQVLTTGALSPDRAQLLQIGAFGVGILDWTAAQPASSQPFVLPSFSVSTPAPRRRRDRRSPSTPPSTRAAGSSASCSSCCRS